MKQLMKSLLLAGAAVAILAIASPAAAQNITVSANVQERCTFNVANALFAFGEYDPTSGTDLDLDVASLTYRCNRGADFTIDISAGGDGVAGGLRDMENQTTAGEYLSYQLYSDAGRTTVWGSGAGNNVALVSPSANLQTVNIYGRIPAGQDALVGAYQDIVTVTFTP
jgi:spore coat protein U-like protein